MTERWLPVVGWEGLYEVSDMGRVRSLPRKVRGGLTRMRKVPGTYLKGSLSRGPYPRVMLRADGRKATHSVHRLVAEAFLGPGPAGTEVCHGDGDPTNNHVENLRWDTHSSNIRDAVAHGTWNMTRRTHCPRGHELAEPNLMKKRFRELGVRSCLACSRAPWRVKTRGESMQEAADYHYAQIAAHWRD